MLRIKIKDKEYDLPNSWDEVTVAQYFKIINIENKDKNSLYYFEIISILINCDISILYANLVDTSGFVKLIQAIGFLFKEIIVENKPKVIIEGESWNVISKLEGITFGNWISIETLLKSNSFINSILTILLRDSKGEHSEDINGQIKRIDLLKITDVLGIVNNFLGFREKFYSQYKNFFKMEKNKEDVEEEIDKRAGLYKQYDGEKWFWMNCVDKLVSNLNYNPDEVYKLNIYGAVNWLNFYHERHEYEMEMQRNK